MASDDSNTVFGRYKLLRRLAFGGMAEIFLASLQRDAGFEKRVVLKRILPQFGTDPEFVRMFIDEAVLAARLTHPNIVQVYDFGEVDGVYFIAMEFVDGADLRTLLRAASAKGRLLKAAEIAALGEGAARGLAYAHELTDENGRPLHIVHRDVSPHNILVSRSGDAKITDFGIAKAAVRASRTAAGTVKGKTAYMAPEQAAGREVDARSDLFALGVVLWECLSGRRLFEADSDMELLRRVIACEIRPPREHRPDVPEALERVVMRCLAATPDERYPDLKTLQSELSAFRFALGTDGAVHLGALVDELVDKSAGAKELSRRTVPLPAPLASGEAPAQLPNPTLVTAPTGADTLPAQAVTVVHAPTDLKGSAARPNRGKRSIWIAGAALVAVVGVVVVFAASSFRSASETAATPPPTTARTVPTPVGASVLRLASTPAGARVLVNGLDVGLRTPATLPALEVGVAVSITALLEGYQPWSMVVVPRAPQESLDARLEPQARSPAGPEPSEPARVARHRETKPAGEAPGLRRETSRGKLSLRSMGPWLDVYLGKRKLGTTPLQSVEVPAGKLQLRLVNPQAGVDRTIEVEVSPAEETRRTVTVE